MDKSRARNFRRLFFDLRAEWLNSPAPLPSFFDGSRDDFNRHSVKPVAWGWTARTIRSGEAAIRLGEAGLGEEASPLLRSAIEHSMFLWWLQADRGKVLEVLKRNQKVSLERLLKAQTIGWDLDSPTLARIQELIDDATEQHKSFDTFSRVKNLAERYPDDLGNIFQAWLVDTQTSHATLQSAGSYFRTIPDTDPAGPAFRFLISPEPVGGIAAKAAIAAHVALTGYSRAADLEDHYQPKLAAFSTRFAELGAV